MFTQLSLTEANKNVRQMRVIGVLSLAPMRLSVSWKLHNAFIRNEFLPFLWGLLSPNVYTSPLLLSGFGDFDLQHLLVDWTDAKRTNPLKKKDRKQLCKAEKVVFSFSKAPWETSRKHYCLLSSRVCFSYLVSFESWEALLILFRDASIGHHCNRGEEAVSRHSTAAAGTAACFNCTAYHGASKQMQLLGTARDSDETRMFLLNGEGQRSKTETVWDGCCQCWVTVDSLFWDFPVGLCKLVPCPWLLLLGTFISPVQYKIQLLSKCSGGTVNNYLAGAVAVLWSCSHFVSLQQEDL